MLDHMRDAATTPSHFVFFEDFIRHGAAVDADSIDFTAIGSGTLATQATNGGWIRVSGAATTDNSGGQIQAAAAHACTTGKNITFKARCQVSEATTTNGATDSDVFIGLFPVDTSIEASLPDNGIYFVKADGGISVSAIVRVAASNVLSQEVSTAFDKLVHTYGISIIPNGSTSIVEFTIDGVAVARKDNIAVPADTVILTPTIAFQSGDATGTKFIDVDYIGSAQTR